MIKRLKIENYVLIKSLEIDFNKEFTVITGETGAGKSILLGALGLVSGKRADVAVLNEKDKKCVVECIFDVEAYNLKSYFEKHDLDFEPETIIRREINPKGKSRAFINDTPVNLSQVKELTGELLDIHSQHQTLNLGEANFQMNLVDSYAQSQKELTTYKKQFIAYNEAKAKLEDLVETEKKASLDKDYFQFQFNELEEANIQVNELEELESRQKFLENAEDIKSALYTTTSIFNEEQGALNQLREAKNSISNVADTIAELSVLVERLNSGIVEFEDIVYELEKLEGETSFDQEELQKVTDRIDLILTLQSKHRVQTVDELLAIQNELEEKLLQFGSLETEIETAKKVLSQAEQLAKKEATNLSKKRKAATPKLEKTILGLLKNLALSDAQFKVAITSCEMNSTGVDKVQLLFTANKGTVLQDIAKAASGGEMSRLMLSLKSVLAEKSKLPTIIFDEIDTGVSGEVAYKMAEIMKTMGEQMQVLAITHLPQVAARGTHHYHVVKKNVEGKTVSAIKVLNPNDRVDTIAHLLSGEKTTQVAVENAKELLAN